MTGRDDALADLDAAYQRLQTLVAPVDEAHGVWDGALDGWSIANALQHIDGWLQEGIGGIARLQRGERATPPGIDYAGVDAWNARFVEQRAAQSMAEARAAWEQTHAAFRRALAALPLDRFAPDRTAARMARSHADHYREHAAAIEAFLHGAH